MPKTTKTTVNRNENGQYQTTVPKALGDAMELDGAKLEWKVDSGSSLTVKILHEEG